MSTKEELEQEANALRDEMMGELKLWQEEIGVHPGAIVEFDAFMLDSQLHALTKFLIDKGVIENELEFYNFATRYMIDQMKFHRPNARAAKQEALRQHLTAGLPRMDIPGNHKH